MADFAERTEQATPRRREKAREKGQLARSRDLSSIAAMGGVIIALGVGGGYFMDSLKRSMERFLSLGYGTDPIVALRAASIESMLITMPVLLAALSLGVATNLAQGGIVFKPLELKFEGINPVSGLKKIFSLPGLVEFLKSMAKFSVAGYLFYYVMKKDLPLFSLLMTMNAADLSKESGRLIMKAVTYGFAVFFVVGVVDYMLERWRFERSVRMSREEIKEEQRESEGDPMIKSRVKAIQREMARKRMMHEVPKATVVITNPTHIAVALKYEDKKMSAPKVVAKGADAVAAKIKEIARAHSVPIVEDKPLARVLYKTELGADIPEKLYKAVARILAYIYKLRGAA